MNRPFSFSIDEYYHLYTRGVDKRLIFLDERDRWRFLKTQNIKWASKLGTFKKRLLLRA